MARRTSLFDNLPSFQFGASLKDESLRSYLFLRDRSYLFHCNLTAHATYFLGVAYKYWKLSNRREKFVVGVIGSDKIAANLIDSIFEYSGLGVDQVLFSQGRDWNVFNIDEKATIVQDIGAVARSADVLFICCSQTSFDDLASSIKDDIKGAVYSLVYGIPTKKVKRSLHSECAFHPTYNFNNKLKCDSSFIKKPCTMANALAIAKVREITCPLVLYNTPLCVYVDTSYVSSLLALSVHFQGLSAVQALSVLFEDFKQLTKSKEILTAFSDTLKNRKSIDMISTIHKSLSLFYAEKDVIEMFKANYMAYFDRLAKLEKK